MNLIIAGTRTFNDPMLMGIKVVDFITTYRSSALETIVIGCGNAIGADTLGKHLAKRAGYKVKIFLPDWARYGKAAGPIRNERMAKWATHCIVFWDGKSAGAKSMIDFAGLYKVTLEIVIYGKTKRKE